MSDPSRATCLPRALAACLALILAGCGGSSGESDPGTAGKPPGPRVLASFEERGDQPSGSFTSLLMVDGKLLAGTEDGLDVFRFDRETGFRPETRFELRSNPVSPCVVRHIRPGEPGTAWVSSTEGVAQYRGGKIPLKEESGPVRDAVVYSDTVWIARSRSLETYEPVISALKRFPIQLPDEDADSALPQAKKPLSLAPLGTRSLLVGTEFGILALEGGENGVGWNHLYGPWDQISYNTITRRQGNTKLPGNRINNLRVSPDGSRVAACTEGGLAVFDAQGRGDWENYVGVHRVNRSDPVKGVLHEEIPGNVEMPSSDVLDVVFGDGVLYLATLKGLVVVPAEGPGAGPARVLDIGDGLPSSKITALELDRIGKVLFVATPYGLAALDVGSPGA